MVVFVLLLLLAAALGILGLVVKVALVAALSFVVAVVLLAAIGYYYVRHRFRRFVRDAQRQQQQGPQRGYPTTGTKGPGPGLPE